MKLKLALVGIAHFLSHGLQAQQATAQEAQSIGQEIDMLGAEDLGAMENVGQIDKLQKKI